MSGDEFADLPPAPPDTEMEAITDMLGAAGEYGLEVECVYEMVQQVKGGRTVEEACAAAKWEWDVCSPSEAYESVAVTTEPTACEGT